MKTKFTFGGSLLFLLSLAILLTIYLAWLVYPLEISWLNLTSRIPFQSQTIQHNFNVLMNYLTNPLSQVLAMPDFPSSASGLHHFAVVKGLFHLSSRSSHSYSTDFLSFLEASHSERVSVSLSQRTFDHAFSTFGSWFSWCFHWI